MITSASVRLEAIQATRRENSIRFCWAPLSCCYSRCLCRLPPRNWTATLMMMIVVVVVSFIYHMERAEWKLNNNNNKLPVLDWTEGDGCVAFNRQNSEMNSLRKVNQVSGRAKGRRRSFLLVVVVLLLPLRLPLPLQFCPPDGTQIGVKTSKCWPRFLVGLFVGSRQVGPGQARRMLFSSSLSPHDV